MSVCLLVIDPQVDFSEGGKLAVAGATKDLQRLGTMVKKWGGDIDDIRTSLDSHYHVHIAHSCWWVSGKDGSNPAPFTAISEEDVLKGVWKPSNPEWIDWAKHYVHELKVNGRYMLMIWPDHCIIGTPGQCIQPDFLEALTGWEEKYTAIAPRTTKGSNPFTEHFSVVKADVPHPKDPGTRMNGQFVDTLKQYDTILIAGEALSHCVANTIRDVAAEFSDDQVKKFVLLEDACSNVAGCEKMGQSFVNEMVKKGMRISQTDKFFK